MLPIIHDDDPEPETGIATVTITVTTHWQGLALASIFKFAAGTIVDSKLNYLQCQPECSICYLLQIQSPWLV